MNLIFFNYIYGAAGLLARLLCKDSVVILRTIIACLFLTSCSTIPSFVDERPIDDDSRSSSDEDNHR